MAYTEVVTYGPSSSSSGDGVVTLPYSSVSYSARVEYDSTGRSVAGYTLTFRIKSWIIGNVGSPATDQTVQAQGDQLRSVINAFNIPRGVFRWYYQGSGQAGSYFEISGLPGAANETASNAYVDRRYGPRCRVVAADRTNAGISAMITWEMECFVAVACDLPADIDEFSWSFAYSIDQDFNCTRNVRGTYRFRSMTHASVAVSLLGAGGFWPALPTGFYRQSINHSLSADGLTLEWSLTDKQVWRTLPRPMTSGRASMSSSLQGAILTKRMDCEFGAPVDVSKTVIIDFILTLIQFRFPGAFGGSNSEYLTGVDIHDNQFENRIGATVTSRVIPGTGSQISSTNVSAATTQDYLRSLFGDVAQVNWIPSGRTNPGWTASDGSTELRSMVGTAGLAPTATPPFDLCSTSLVTVDGSEVFNSTNLTSDSQITSASPSRMAGPGNQDTSVPDAPPGVTPQISTEQSKNPITYFQEETHWTVKRHIQTIPIMASTGASTQNYYTQQTAPPEVTLIQVGCIRRYGALPNLPVAPFANFAGALADEEKVSPMPAKLLANGVTWEFGLSYARKIVIPGATSIPGVYPPINPQLGSYSYTSTVLNELNSSGTPQSGTSTDGSYSPDYRYP